MKGNRIYAGAEIKGFGPLTVQFFLKIDTEGDKTRGADKLFQYFTT